MKNKPIMNFRERLLRYQQRFNFISQHPNRKSWPRIFWEMNLFSLRKRCPKSDYILFRLFQKSVSDIHGYIPTNIWYEFVGRVSVPDLIDVFDDKLKFHETAARYGLPTPILAGYFRKGEFQIIENGKITVFPNSQADKALSKLLALYPCGVFSKPVRGSGGKGAFRLHSNLDTGEFLSALGSTDYLFQECVQQHKILGAINPNSLNTLRLTTVRDEQNTPHIVGGFLRIGRGNAEVDNASSGGIMNFLNLETGKLDAFGYTTMEYGGVIMQQHPDTSVVFEDITLPYYDDVVALVKNASECLPNPIVGWDVAITETGPILIEANRRPNLTTDQAINGPYMQRPKMRETILRLTNGKGILLS